MQTIIQRYHGLRYETLLAIAPSKKLSECIEWINSYGENGWCMVATAVGTERIEVVFQRLKTIEISQEVKDVNYAN